MANASPTPRIALDTAGPDPSAWQPVVVAGVLVVSAVFAGLIGLEAGGNQVLLLAIGGLLGLSLYHAAFGFTAAYRRFFLTRRSAGLRAQIVMLALASLGFAPLLAFDGSLSGAVAPVGVSLVVGAFMFGIGMQLAGGCASGTLYTVGGGSTRMVIVLIAFIASSYVGTWHAPWWQALPSAPAVSAYESLGWIGGLTTQGVWLALLYVGCRWFEQRQHLRLEPLLEAGSTNASGLRVRLLRGPWPFLWGAVALALLNVATLIAAGRPWGITGAFALWGAKVAQALGFDPTAHAYWQRPGPRAALDQGLAHDVTSVMDLGLVLGACLAAGLAGKFRPTAAIGFRPALAALIGGLLLGYGARLSYGCNIGAFFSGVASGSPHGWVWIAAALAGTAIAIPLRPLFGLKNEARS
ncbi:MAG: YeeE/YedE family protein [Alphaproteobacteria bacterium]|nr:YeeE/YedE family protein [Alphaproteobacteria bacterium]